MRCAPLCVRLVTLRCVPFCDHLFTLRCVLLHVNIFTLLGAPFCDHLFTFPVQGALGYVRVYGVPITKDMLARSASRSSAPVTALAAPELMAAYRFDAGA